MPLCARNGCGRQSPWLGRPTGISVDDRWYCSIDCVERLARLRLTDARPASAGLPRAGHLRLGVWLQQLGVASSAIQDALARQRVSRLKLGAQLVEMNAASEEIVLRGLARQAGAGFIAHVDPATVALAPGDLSPHAVRALNLVPFSRPDRGRVRVACAAPVPHVGLAAFARLTGLAPEPYLVTDRNYTELVDAYGSATTAGQTPAFVTAPDLASAAQEIASVAASDGHARMTDTRLAPYTWVRVYSDTGTRDVVLEDHGKEVA